ncbi:hypothetical protein ACFX1R_016458 [Malus domestica]
MKRSQIAPPASASASDEVEDTDAKINKDDRFSGLPDEVVHRILSPLPYSDVIRVGSLSKRCRQVGSSIPTLNFSQFPSDSTDTFDKRLELLASLDNFFSRRQLANGKDKIRLQTFDLEWEFPHHGFERDTNIPNWRDNEARRVCASIRNAVDCRLENLSVFYGIWSSANAKREPVEFPCCAFNCGSLKSIDLEMFDTIIKARSIATCTVSNLVCLRLKEVTVEDGDGFCKWVSSACRFLKELVLKDVARLQNITIESPSLKSFRLHLISGWSPLYHLHISAEKLERVNIACNGRPLEISAPNLRYLRMQWRGTKMMNIRNPGEFNRLEKAELEVVNNQPGVEMETASHDQFLLSSVVQSVKVLALHDRWTITTLSKEGCTAPPLHNVWCLRMSTWSFDEFDNNLVPTVASLFKRLPNLNTLEIYVSHLFGIPEHGFDSAYWQLQNLDFISQLKHVTLELEVSEGFNDSNLIEFARYVLEHAQNLKKMAVICEPSQSRLISSIRSITSTSNASVVFLEKGSICTSVIWHAYSAGSVQELNNRLIDPLPDVA